MDKPAAAVAVCLAPASTRLLLQASPSDRAALSAVLRLALPQVMLTAATTGDWAALHLSPDDWQLIGPPGDSEAIRATLAATDVPHSLVDISERSLTLEISGPGATDILAAGCPVDLWDGVFAVGRCTRTLFGKVDVMVWKTDETSTFRLEFARSFADYVERLLALAAGEPQGDIR